MLPDAFPWWGLLALSTAAFTDVMTDLLPAGLLPQMSRDLGVPEARVGLLVSAFAVASALAAALPWVTLAFAAAALGTVALARRRAFPRDRK